MGGRKTACSRGRRAQEIATRRACDSVAEERFPASDRLRYVPTPRRYNRNQYSQDDISNMRGRSAGNYEEAAYVTGTSRVREDRGHESWGFWAIP